MKINMADTPGFSQPIVGNVYPINGGYGRKAGHLMILLAITEKGYCLFLIVDKNGEPIGVTSYGTHAIEDRCPVAFVPGIDELQFHMQPIT